MNRIKSIFFIQIDILIKGKFSSLFVRSIIYTFDIRYLLSQHRNTIKLFANLFVATRRIFDQCHRQKKKKNEIHRDQNNHDMILNFESMSLGNT